MDLPTARMTCNSMILEQRSPATMPHSTKTLDLPPIPFACMAYYVEARDHDRPDKLTELLDEIQAVIFTFRKQTVDAYLTLRVGLVRNLVSVIFKHYSGAGTLAEVAITANLYTQVRL